MPRVQGGRGRANREEQARLASRPPRREPEEKDDTPPGNQCEHHPWKTSGSLCSTRIGLQYRVEKQGLNIDGDQPQGKLSAKHSDQQASNPERSSLGLLQCTRRLSTNTMRIPTANPSTALCGGSPSPHKSAKIQHQAHKKQQIGDCLKQGNRQVT